MNHQLLKSIIKTMLLTEAPIDVWKAKNKSLTSEQLSQAEKYFVDLTGKYIASLHPVAKDLASLSFEQLETLYKTVEASKNKNLKSEYVKWITKKLKQLPDLSLQQVIEDYIPPLLSLQKNKEKFEPNFLENLQSVEQLNQALNQKVSSGDLAAPVPEEQFGKLAEENGWILYMPHTTEASCEIGKTGGRRDTTWCTTRPDASNMFLQYSASPDRNIILFSVVKKGVNAEKDTHAKMSVGFIDGKPEFNQGAGGVSVDAKNNDLSQKKFEQVLGKDLASKFLKIMQEKAGSLNGEHPAKDEFRKLVQNPKAFQAKIDGFAEDENGQELRRNFIEGALGYEEISPEVLTALSREEDESIRTAVAQNPKAPPELLTALSREKDENIRYVVAKNPNTPREVLTVLAVDKDLGVRLKVAKNPNTPREALAALARDKDEYVNREIAKNPNAPPEALAVLARDKDIRVRERVAGNPNTPREVLTVLAGDKDLGVRYVVAKNPNTPREVLTALSGDKNEYVRREIAQNPKTPPETLTVLAGDPDLGVRLRVAQNPKTPPETLAALSKDEDEDEDEDEDKIIRNTAVKTLNDLKAKPLVEAIIMEKVWRRLLRSI